MPELWVCNAVAGILSTAKSTEEVVDRLDELGIPEPHIVTSYWSNQTPPMFGAQVEFRAPNEEVISASTPWINEGVYGYEIIPQT